MSKNDSYQDTVAGSPAQETSGQQHTARQMRYLCTGTAAVSLPTSMESDTAAAEVALVRCVVQLALRLRPVEE